MIQENSKKNTITLGDFTYKKNEFITCLTSENIKLYLNSSPFINKNGIVDRVIKTIHSKLGTREHFWLDIEYMEILVNKYNRIPHSAFHIISSTIHKKFWIWINSFKKNIKIHHDHIHNYLQNL
jgi:hypothetical protein